VSVAVGTTNHPNSALKGKFYESAKIAAFKAKLVRKCQTKFFFLTNFSADKVKMALFSHLLRLFTFRG
jgi:hypothetical protein